MEEVFELIEKALEEAAKKHPEKKEQIAMFVKLAKELEPVAREVITSHMALGLASKVMGAIVRGATK